MKQENVVLAAKLAVEYWKLLKGFERAIQRLPQEHVAKTVAQHRFSATRLENILAEAKVRLVTFEGKVFEAALPASAVNPEDASPECDAVIESTVEPAIVQDMNVILMGKVVLRSSRLGVSNASGD